MKTVGVVATLLLATFIARADRFVMKDNTIRVGKLTGMREANFLAIIQGRLEEIPVASVSVVMLDDAVRQAVVQSSLPSVPRPTAESIGSDPVGSVVSAFSQVSDGIKVDLGKCVKQGSKAVICSLNFTNLEPDRALGIVAEWPGRSNSYYVDERGMQRVAQIVELGTGRGYTAETPAVTDVAIPSSITFPGVATGVNALAKLSISCYVIGRTFSVEFRRIPLQGA